jgi:stage III sporulation protein AC
LDVNTLIKIAGVGMIVAVSCQILSRAGRDEQSALVSLAGVVVVLLLIVDKIGTLFSTLRSIFGI